MKLELDGLEVDCILGDLPEERGRAARIALSAVLEVGEEAGVSDRLADTADYAALSEKLRDALVAGKFRLLERAAHVAAEVCLVDPRVSSAEVRVTKRGAVPGLGSASAVCRLSKGAALPEYELAGIETIARGVCVADGKILLCRAKGAKTSYLPGGHIEFGETGREALVREIKEETGLSATAGEFLGVVENSFVQHGRPHAEINLVYGLSLDGGAAEVASREDWISFEWRSLGELEEAGLLPEAFRRLGRDPSAKFGV